MPDDPQPVWPQQSPIDIAPGSALPVVLPRDYLVFGYPDADLSGHFERHNFWFDNPPPLHFGGKEAYLERIHIHSRSEHRLDGRDFDFEVHFVNPLRDQTGDSKAVVIGVFFTEEAGAVTPKSVRGLNEAIARSMEGKAEGDRSGCDVKGHVNPTHFLPTNRGHFFRYEGSLTTEPFSEAISWVVMPHVVAVTSDDVAALKRCAHESARRTQPLGRRFVLKNFV